MGDISGETDEFPQRIFTMDNPIWISECEVTNAQFRRFDPSHDSGYYTKRRDRADGKGLSLNGDDQPVVRVSFEKAMDFCHWLSKRSGLTVMLPTEEQWEYACRAGTAGELGYGDLETDFSRHANVADKAIVPLYNVTGGVVVLQDVPADTRFDDGGIATAPVASYQPNAWGLYDMHGNAAEWTGSTYQPYPYREEDGRNLLTSEGRKVVRGGSYYDRPKRCRSAFRLSFPAWQRVHNVGFRVVSQAAAELAAN